MSVKLKCVTCGRPFPRGQGVVLSKGGLTLTFHSSRCAYRFFKLLLDRIDERCFVDVAKGLASELERVLEERRARVQKRI